MGKDNKMTPKETLAENFRRVLHEMWEEATSVFARKEDIPAAATYATEQEGEAAANELT